MAGRGVAPAGLVATRHSGGGGAPPGTTRSPCQELADVWTAAIGLSPNWAERPKRKARPAVDKTPLPARREAPAASRNGGGHHNGQRLSARRPSCLEGREEHSPDAMRIAGRRSFALSNRAPHPPALPLGESTRAIWRAARGKRRSRVERRIIPHPSRLPTRSRSFASAKAGHATCELRRKIAAGSPLPRGERGNTCR